MKILEYKDEHFDRDELFNRTISKGLKEREQERKNDLLLQALGNGDSRYEEASRLHKIEIDSSISNHQIKLS